jgi:hypothetical protein
VNYFAATDDEVRSGFAALLAHSEGREHVELDDRVFLGKYMIMRVIDLLVTSTCFSEVMLSTLSTAANLFLVL